MSFLQSDKYGWIFNENDIIEFEIDKLFINADVSNFILSEESVAKNNGIEITNILIESGFGHYFSQFNGNIGLNDGNFL